MNSKSTDFAVGLFVLAGLAAIVFMAIKLGGGRFVGGDTQSVDAIFSNIGGLSSGSAVAISGVKVGTVGEIKLDQDTLKARVQLRIDKRIALYDDAIASIKTSGLIGDKYISLYPGTPDLGMELEGPIVDTEPALDLEGLISRFAFGDVTQSGSGSSSSSQGDEGSEQSAGSEESNNPFPSL